MFDDSTLRYEGPGESYLMMHVELLANIGWDIGCRKKNLESINPTRKNDFVYSHLCTMNCGEEIHVLVCRLWFGFTAPALPSAMPCARNVE